MDISLPQIRLGRGREKPILNRHPWIFSGAIDSIVSGEPQPGDIVDVISHDHVWLARAYYNPKSQIQARILTWQQSEEIDEGFWRKKIELAQYRRFLLELEPGTTAYRLINAEADGVPGLIVDRYGDFLVIQCLTLGIDVRKTQLVQVLNDVFKPAGILERSDAGVRKQEGLSKVVSILSGDDPPSQLFVLENGIKMEVDLYRGHKTGLYLDQRDSRMLVCHPSLVKEREILNVFAYTGAFSLRAAMNGSGPITNVEESGRFLEAIGRNMSLNQLNRPNDRYIAGDAFKVLRKLRDNNRLFDMAILDPPKFAHGKQDVPAACRGYKDINLLAMQLLKPNGLLATFSCSGLISRELFQKVLFAASVDAGREVQLLHLLGQGPDHPVLLTFPESSYLKGFLCRVE